MNNSIRAALCIALIVCGTCAHSQPSGGDKKPGWSGTVGVGPFIFPRYNGGNALRVLPAPLLSVTYEDIAYVDLLRAGVYLLSSADKKMGLGFAVEPRFGFRPGYGPRLTGMTTRRDRLEGGPSFDWDNEVAAINLAYFGELSGAGGGTSARASLYKQFLKNERWDAGVLAGVDRISAKTVNYFFGVSATEAIATRPTYQPGGTINFNLGLSGTYNLDKRHALIFGVNSTRLGGSAANSPIVETRQATIYYVGYGWNL